MNRFVASLLVLSCALTIVGLTTSPAQAALLPAGSVLIPTASEAEPVGGVILTSSANSFTVAGSFSGTLYSDVITGDASNTLGGLTFVYRLTNDAASGPNSIGRVSIADMSGFAIDASYNPTAGVVPALIDRNPSANVVGFDFVPSPVDPLTGFLVPGQSSARLVVQTNAASYTAAVASLIDGGVTTVPTFGPAILNNPDVPPDGPAPEPTVPEPSALLLTVLVFGAMVYLRPRRAATLKSKALS